MTTIKTNSWGGTGALVGTGKSTPDMNETFRDVAEDLVGIQSAMSQSATAIDLATVITLANELQTLINITAQYNVKTQKG